MKLSLQEIKEYIARQKGLWMRDRINVNDFYDERHMLKCIEKDFLYEESILNKEDQFEEGISWSEVNDMVLDAYQEVVIYHDL